MAQIEINKDLVIEGTNTNLEKLIPTVLYTSSQPGGDLCPVTLSDNWSNYTFIEVWYNNYDTNAGTYDSVSSYGLKYIKIYVASPYVSMTNSYDSHFWGTYWNTLLYLTGTNTLTENTGRGYRFGGSESAVREWWTRRNAPAIVKVIGWKY